MASITIKNIEKPLRSSIEKDLDWLCKSFGFVSPRDSKETASKIFKEIIIAAHKNKELTSEQIAKKIGISRNATLVHIKNYLESGLIVKKKTKYVLRERSIFGSIEEVKLDIIRMLNNIQKIAKEIDNKLGFKER